MGHCMKSILSQADWQSWGYVLAVSIVRLPRMTADWKSFKITVDNDPFIFSLNTVSVRSLLKVKRNLSRKCKYQLKLVSCLWSNQTSWLSSMECDSKCCRCFATPYSSERTTQWKSMSFLEVSHRVRFRVWM